MNKCTDTSVKTIFALTVSAIALATLTACGSTSEGRPGETPAPGIGCASVQPNVKDDTPTVAILGQTGPDLTATYGADIALVTAAAATTAAHVVVNGVSTDSTAPTLLTNVILDGEGNNQLERTANLHCKTATIQKAISTLEQTPASQQPDAFNAITTLAGILENNPSTRPVDVVLLTPLVANAGGVDLSDPRTLDDPIAAINTLAGNGLIHSCKGYRFYGVSPATNISDVQAAKLREFWRLYADKCGGQFVNWSAHLATFPAVDAIPAVDRTQLQVKTTPTTITASLSADVLFDADSAVLLDTATPALKGLLDLVTAHSGPLLITGYANPANPGINSGGDKELSKLRAEAVASWLLAANVEPNRITTAGLGTADAVYPHPENDEQSAANRRVVTVINTDAA